MSYEGYAQLLCEDGHESSRDVYDKNHDGNCHCGKEVVWWNLVDETNGSFDDDQVTRIDGYIELTIKDQPVLCQCKDCGNQHFSREATYHLPEKGKGHRGKWKWEP